MSYIDQSVFDSIRTRLSFNQQVRFKRGALTQDFDRQQGEVFFGNLKQAEFEALPLRSKRKGGPARITRILSETVKGVTRVFVPTYEELYKEKDYFEVYVHTAELHDLGIEY
ncbi:hypothetical protein EXS62_01980 [Candidatus Kaiserbacteria bacterium]|nr:hypothetical protein [Candidatus Kaiserbacteria bacterium]